MAESEIVSLFSAILRLEFIDGCHKLIIRTERERCWGHLVGLSEELIDLELAELLIDKFDGQILAHLLSHQK